MRYVYDAALFAVICATAWALFKSPGYGVAAGLIFVGAWEGLQTRRAK
jgi:hypothetical protein